MCERETHNDRDRYAVAVAVYWPRFLLFSLVVAFSTSLLARAIACDGREEDNTPLGSGRPSFGLKKLRIDIVLACYFRTVIFCCCNN